MSIKAMSRVWERSKQKGGALLLLLAIADYAHDDGTGAYPTVAKLAEKTRMSESNVHVCLRSLVADGELVIHAGAGPRHANRYDVILPDADGGRGAKSAPAKSAPSKNDRVQNGGREGPESGPRGVQNDAPTIRINRHVKPSGDPSIEGTRARGAAAPDPPPAQPALNVLPLRKRPPAPQPAPESYSFLDDVCELTHATLRGDARRREALKAEELLARCEGSIPEALAYLQYRLNRGDSPDLSLVARDYAPGWRLKAAKMNGVNDEAARRHGRVSADRQDAGIRGGAGGPGAAQGESKESRLRRELQRQLRPDLYSDAGVLPGVPRADPA